MKSLFTKGQKFTNWTLTRYLGHGGNGEVWECQNALGEKNAIKLLKKIKQKPYGRFIDEVKVIEQNSDIQGIVPIIEKYLPEKLYEETPFYVMPLAIPADYKLFSRRIEDTVNAILQIAETLSKLHERNIHHRDIKPDNILFYNSRYYLADFGLVDYPDKKEVSQNNEEIGAKWTMAPEMRRESSNADASKADIYSLAKTLWMFLTSNKKGFDGQYKSDSIIDLKKKYPKNYTSTIDELLEKSTDNDPKKRPTIEEFITALHEWKKIFPDFHKRNQQEWFEIQAKLFPSSIPTRVIWEDVNDIIKVLKIISSIENLNHVFLPRSGGLDLKDVRLAHEEGCIELDFESIHIIKPKRLLFESFSYDYEWNYFRLELDELKPSDFQEEEEDIFDNDKPNYEFVSELSPGEYNFAYILENAFEYENDYVITDFSRIVTRWFSGSFVVFCKRSTYNLISDTYDGRHNKMTTDEFRNYIERTVDFFKEEDKKKNFVEDSFVSEEQLIEEKRKKRKEQVNNYIEEDDVYRCGWCGNIVDEDGSELNTNDKEYSIKVLEKFGDLVLVAVHGDCCKHMRH